MMWVTIITIRVSLINNVTILNILMFRILVEETVGTTARQVNLVIYLKGTSLLLSTTKLEDIYNKPDTKAIKDLVTLVKKAHKRDENNKSEE